MPVVQGKLTHPDLTEWSPGGTGDITLVDQFGVPVRGFKVSTNETINGPLTISTNYSITLADNAAGINPANTMWRRTWYLPGGVTQTDYFVVPAGGGPYQEAALATGITPLPLPAPTNDLGYTEITADTSALAVTSLTAVAVPNLTVTVPDIATPAYLYAQIKLVASVANADIYAAVGPVGGSITDVRTPFWCNIGATANTSPASCAVTHRLPAHSPGTWQVFVGSNASMNLTAKATATSVCFIEARSA